MLTNQLTKKAILKSNALDEFPGSTCCITISVGQPPHEKDKLISTLAAVNNQFKSTRIMVCDSLQRHTMKIFSLENKQEIHHRANILGKQWIERNSFFIKKMDIPVRIFRWDEWLNHPNYNQKYMIINDRYLKDTAYKASVDETANHFLSRNEGKICVTPQQAFELSKEYLIEECAVMLLLADDGCQFEVYPSERNFALDYVYKHIISVFNDKLMRAVSIKFKNRSSVVLTA